MTPRRVQLRRTAGWRMPADTVKVDRSTRWGNPFQIGKAGPGGRVAFDQREAVDCFIAMLGDPALRALAGYPEDLSPLVGRNLACWCHLDAPCHADVLLVACASGAHD